MKQQLNDQINSFGSQSKKSINSILSEVSSEKVEIGRLVNKLTSFTSAADYAPRVIRQLEPVQREFIVDMFRDLDLRVKTQFDISNSLSTLSSAMTNVFGSEIEKIEKDLQYLDAYVKNWSFISGEDDLYNSSFVENFDNESNSYINESSSFRLTDRDGISLSSQMSARVDPVSGKLKYSSDYETSLINVSPSQIKSISYETNFSKEYISSDTGIEKILNNIVAKPWHLTVKSPFIIRQSLLDTEKYKDFKNNINIDSGAQVAVNIEFNSNISLSRIRINPNIIDSLAIAQIIVETENTANGSETSQTMVKTALLSSPLYISRNYDIDLDSTYSIKSITIILFQREYNKVKNTSIQSEVNSKMVSSIYKEIKKHRSDGHDTLQDYVIRFFLQETDKAYILRNKKVYQYNYTSYYPKSLSKTNFGTIEKLAKNKYFSDLDAFNKFKNTSLISNIVFSIIAHSLGSRLRNKVISTYVESNVKDNIKPLGSFYSSGIIPVSDSNIVDKNIHLFNQTMLSISQNDASELLNAVETINLYEYNISILNIVLFSRAVSTMNNQNKSFFISKKMPTNGRPLKVKMSAKYFEELSYSNEDISSDKTSIEFSVSVKDSPNSETDWLPILPYGEDFVRSELLFTNSSGEATLRFEPLAESVTIYEDGRELIPGSFFVNIKSIKVNNYKSGAKYFASYRVRYPDVYQEVMLNPQYLSTPILVTPSTSGANGEYFDSAGQSNKVRLLHNPYIDQARFVNASYSSYVGTVTSSNTSFASVDNSSYSPVKVVFLDGTSAINITNYIVNNNVKESFYETDSVLFIHKSDSIIFNQQIDKPFRVLYQYNPDSFRYRLIMRSLTSDDQNYSVDRLVFKFSTENRDNMLINLVKYDNLFKNKVN
jgi:hypothetical protein